MSTSANKTMNTAGWSETVGDGKSWGNWRSHDPCKGAASFTSGKIVPHRDSYQIFLSFPNEANTDFFGTVD